MKKTLILASMAALALVSCAKNEFTGTENQKEISVVAMAGEPSTRGYSTGVTFYETLTDDMTTSDPVSTTKPRTMLLSAYLYPQNGEAGNYFVGEIYAKGESDDLWHADPKIYWPVGSKMDFLAYSLSSDSKNVTVAWDEANAASKVVLNVPGENSQNDILFASSYAQKSSDHITDAASGSSPVEMVFNHAQAWLQFIFNTNLDGVVTIKRIVLEDIYNAGDLTVTNNNGDALAEWSFSGQPKDIDVDDIYKVSESKLVKKETGSNTQRFNMLIPQQKKTSFVLYYTLGSDTQELSYRFTTDQKTWLMGEKYIYNITINTDEITVKPSVTSWAEGDVTDIPASI